MGGDGGTISSSRAYLRGVGKADHTADPHRPTHNKEEKAEHARAILSTCAISGESLDFSPGAEDIVACPYGRLYKREKVLEALLMRSSSGALSRDCLQRLAHIRGRKDLYPVRFHVVEGGRSRQQSNHRRRYVVTCPITESDVGSGSVPALLVVRVENVNAAVDDGPNVISERAIQEMGVGKLQEEYGPFDEKDLIRLAPPKGLFEDIRTNWEERMEGERLEKLHKKKDKKRKRPTDSSKKEMIESQPKKIEPLRNSRKPESKLLVSSILASAAQEARSTVRSAVEKNSVLSDLFGSKVGGANDKRFVSEKERRDGLFTRNC